MTHCETRRAESARCEWSPQTLAERLKAKRRALGVTFSQVAQHLGWDEGCLTRYLNGIWRMPPDQATALEAFLSAGEVDLAPIHRLRRRHRAARASSADAKSMVIWCCSSVNRGVWSVELS